MTFLRTSSLSVIAITLGTLPVSAGRFDPGANPPAPSCTGGTLASYVALGSQGCQAGDLTYFNFGFSSTFNELSSPDTLVATAGNINVLPPNLGDGSVDFYSSFFKVGAGDQATYVISYRIDPPPDILPGFDMYMDASSPVFPGYATIDATVCAGGAISGAICVPVAPPASAFNQNQYHLHVEHSVTQGVISLSDSVLFAAATNYMDVRMVITLNGGPLGRGGSSQINGVQTFQNAIPPQEVPEPGAWMLMAAGLGVIGIARRRR